MVFSSLIFLWIFLPVVLIGSFVLSGKGKNIFLLIASLLFYAWGEPKYIILMLISIGINWTLGLLMDRYETQKKFILIIDIIFNLLLLGYFKYFNFGIEIINAFRENKIEAKEIALPIGISFFTFQILSYIIDLYRGKYKAQKSIINLALYISFFPQLIAGPIVRYEDINEQLENRQGTIEKTAEGVRRFVYGLAKKVIIANSVAYTVDQIYALEPSQITGILAWIGAVFYTLQIYYDFSGYSDMAIGLGKIFGFEFLENFNYPYLSRSVQEFWQRWHMSLGTWFREYVYIPLGGNRKGVIRTNINVLIVFFLTGLWHGASFNFILWGVYYGVLQIIERGGFRKILDKHSIFSHIYTILSFVFGWVLFRAENLRQAGSMIVRMLVPWKYTDKVIAWQQVLNNRTILIAILGVVGAGIIQNIVKRRKWVGNLKKSYLELIYCAGLFLVCIIMLASNTYNPFIYFRF